MLVSTSPLASTTYLPATDCEYSVFLLLPLIDSEQSDLSIQPRREQLTYQIMI